MNTIIVKPNQTFLDVVIMGCGTLEGAMAIAAANELSLTDYVTTGQLLILPQNLPSDKKVLNYLLQNKVEIGTKGREWGSDGFLDESGYYDLLGEHGETLVEE